MMNKIRFQTVDIRPSFVAKSCKDDNLCIVGSLIWILWIDGFNHAKIVKLDVYELWFACGLGIQEILLELMKIV